jgi:hypothetical protein
MNHIDTIAHALANFVNGESAPPLMSTEFAEIMSAIASIQPEDFHLIGNHATAILLERMQAGMAAEKDLRLTRAMFGDRHTN